MSGDEDDDLDALAAEYVLGTLAAPARRAVAVRAAGDATLQRAIARWEDRLLPLTAIAGAVEPPPALWQRIDATLDGAQPRGAPPRAAVRQRARWWDHLPLWRGLAASGIAFSTLFASILAVMLMAPPPAPQFVVVLVAPGDTAASWVVEASSRRQINLIPIARATVPAGKVLQFWTKGDGWAGPVSLGLVTPGQAAHVPASQLPPLEANQLFELTLEPPNGSPTGRPTGPVQFIGRAVKATT